MLRASQHLISGELCIHHGYYDLAQRKLALSRKDDLLNASFLCVNKLH
jgi:hypothetical protein